MELGDYITCDNNNTDDGENCMNYMITVCASVFNLNYNCV